MISGLRGATVWSENVNNLLPFYRDVLGLPVGLEIPGFVVLGKLGTPALALGTHSEVRGRNTDPARHMVGLGTDGLIVPALTRIKPRLTPLAAAGLVIIMIGAVVVTLIGREIGGAVISAVVGILAAFIAYGRWRLAPQQERRHA